MKFLLRMYRDRAESEFRESRPIVAIRSKKLCQNLKEKSNLFLSLPEFAFNTGFEFEIPVPTVP